ncbi:hypothetical protein ONZ51_g12409 [Trametes cubensis]|uniref:Uncharacterized protein n=1 Tax=Trametes cubensis TaxID=1111947 RepID=A0AAD7X4M6_9APHY|nr:hypothetical protein ONZ51_g12409 [Trametes cubensis]
MTNRKQRLREMEQFSKRSNATTKSFSRPSSNARSGSSTTSGAGDRLGPLSDADRKLLRDNNGCFKCRRINAGHRSAECSIGFPSMSTYVSPADQLKGKQPKRDVKKVAAVTVENNEDDATKPAVAAIRPTSPLAKSTGILSEGDSSDDDVRPSVLSSPHLTWLVHVEAPSTVEPIRVLIDTGSPLVLIRDDVVHRLNLRRRCLPTPIPLGNAFNQDGFEAKEWVKVRVSTPDQSWVSNSVRALVVPELCSPLILGTPFFTRNHILVDVFNRALWLADSGIDLTLSSPHTPDAPTESAAEQRRTRDEYQHLAARLRFTQHKDLLREILERVPRSSSISSPSCVAAVRERVERLALQEQLSREDAEMKKRFADCFPADIPHLDDLPSDIFHEINLKNANMTIIRRQYNCPKKYREAWKTLLQQHQRLQAGVVEFLRATT